jgi:hypothetical protein
MKRAFPFDDELETVFGEWSQLGEYLLWFISLLSGILFCKLVYAMSKVVSPIVFPAYNKILDKDKFEWHNRLCTFCICFVLRISHWLHNQTALYFC